MAIDDHLPTFPDRIPRLGELAYDLWWSWNRSARNVFRRLDYSLWRSTEHNPVIMLREVPATRLAEVSADPQFLQHYDAAIAELDRVRSGVGTWWSGRAPELSTALTVYFSAEFAFHQSLPIYAGGLGVLAGDHCKEASDLGIPLVGVGFTYPQGYFRQRISSEGSQEEAYVRRERADAPIGPAVTPAGVPCVVDVPLGDRTLKVATWLLRLGRVTVYLLDTDLEENAPWDRGLSARLYGGDRETRIQQEIVLGLGGVKVIRAMGHSPVVWHLNEGHAGFVILQRIREGIESGLSFEAALGEVRESTVFTTHTPVEAGHDAFPFELVQSHLAGAWGALGSDRDAFLALGSYENGGDARFNMTALALRSAARTNGVSQLHRKVTQRMWANIWPGVAAEDRPVGAITNGIHLPTWLAQDMETLFEEYLGDDWLERHDDPALWDRLAAVPDAELWRVRQLLRGSLFAFIRERARERWTRDRVSSSRMMATGTLLDPSALTIGFARRFTAYKRPEVIFHDTDRLARILTSTERPVQIVFAGKAHPADEAGKHHIQRIVARTMDPAFEGRLAFIGDYDVHVAHFLVQGCDVWLNTPRKPLEASGTSGMKASANGVPHLSISDGWWAEAYTGSNGWQIEPDHEAPTPEEADAADADALYRLLEEEVAPQFYDRNGDDVPVRWLATAREAIRTVAPRFSARRMLKDYGERAYGPAARRTPVGSPSSSGSPSSVDRG